MNPQAPNGGINPPPQIFGGNNQASNTNGSPGFGADFAQGGHWFPNAEYGYNDDADDSGMLGDDLDGNSRDAKRRRIARACDMCRKKKIKCDGKAPKCSHCENYKTECIFTQVEKKRAPPKGAKYIEGLENRLGRMESLLKLSGLLTEEDGGRTDLGTLEKRLQERSTSASAPGTGSGSKSAAASPQSQTSSVRAGATAKDVPASVASTPQNIQIASPDVGNAPTESPAQAQAPSEPRRSLKEVDALAEQMCSLITNNCGETRYIGSSSGFSIFSPRGIQWVNEKTGDISFQHMIAQAATDGQKWDHWKPEVFDDLFSRRVFKRLPSKQECYSLLKDYFENFNCMFPLFHEPTFMHLVEKHYSLDPFEGSGWWASLNVALAIAHRLRVMSNVVDQDEDEHAWGYLKNAMAVMTELTMRNTDLLSVQALLGMALFLQGTPNPQPSFFLVSAAIRLSHSIGLHKRGSGFNLNAVENEQRKRVFWIAYLMDKDICLRSGRPPAQDDDDMNVELPSDDPPDNVGNVPLLKETPDGKKTMNLFRLMCTFAQIQSRVYKQLYSVKASRQSDGELLNTIGELDEALEEWKDGIPIDFRPEHEIKAVHTPLILHVVVLHFAYYNCLTTIHRMSVHHGYWTSRLSDYAIQGLNARPLNPRVFMSAALCVNAARTSIGLIRYIPQGDYACVWLILYYPVSSLVTLFANILQNPQDTRARSDLRLMTSVVNFLTMLERDAQESNGNVRRMLSVCSEFERIARVVLDKAERDIRGRGKRKQAERDREKDRAAGTISAELEEGKTLEQLQVETQAPYRRPVQTPSLRMSTHGSATGASPSSWSGSQGGRGNETQPGHAHPGAQSMGDQMHQQQQQQPPQQQQMQQPQATTRQWDPTPFSMPQGPHLGHMDTSLDMQVNGTSPNFSVPMSQSMDHSMSTPFNMNPGPYNTASPDMTSPHQPNGMNMGNTNAGGGGSFMDSFAGGPSFQQPFVPQDLWQMPMTLEWDWAEGLGMGSFTPGPLFGDEGMLNVTGVAPGQGDGMFGNGNTVGQQGGQ